MKKKKGTNCGYCPVIIFTDNEAGKKIHFINKKPACARCRILKGSRFIKQIKKDKKLFEIEQKRRNETKQKEADEKVKDFALKRQIETKTGRL